MERGSFKGLYTFLEVAKIYGIDDSCLRKQVSRNKFIIGEDVKKMGKTWIITEQAMIRNFGNLKFEEYKKKLEEKEKEKKITANKSHKNRNSKGKISSKKVHSMNEKEEKSKDSWIQGNIKGIELKSFSFNTNDSK